MVEVKIRQVGDRIELTCRDTGRRVKYTVGAVHAFGEHDEDRSQTRLRAGGETYLVDAPYDEVDDLITAAEEARARRQPWPRPRDTHAAP